MILVVAATVALAARQPDTNCVSLLRSDSAYRGVDSTALTFETIYEVASRCAIGSPACSTAGA